MEDKTQYKVFDGDKYIMSFYDLDDHRTPFWKRMESEWNGKDWVKLPKTNNLPDVICACGNHNFQLEYGSYSISAICTACKRRDSVYSG